MSKILVTGGAGFIGSHVCKALLGQGHEVVALDNFDDFYDPAVKRENLTGMHVNLRFSVIEGDIRDEELVDSVLDDSIDVVVHLAARAGVRPSILQPLLYQDVNVRSTAVLLEAARRRRDRKFIFASSSSVYGNNEKVPFSESDPVDHPISPYAATKRAGELLCHTYHHLYDMPMTCLRFFTVYGPRQRPDLAIHKFARLISEGKPIPVFGDGSMSRDFTYIDDTVEGVLAAIDRCSGFHIYNLGGSEPITVKTLVGMLESELGRKATVDWRPEQPGDVNRTFADITLAKRELGYRPATPIRAGITKFVEWFERQPVAC